MYCRYANEVLGEKAARLWNDVTIDEVKAYIAINIIMGINCLPTLDSYWSTHPALGCDWISSTMSKNRYMAINRFLHLNDNAFAAPRNHPGYDPLHKVRPMIDMLRMVFGAYYNPERELSVDEAMIPFRGRSVFKQYIPSKPTKWGIKVWMICESRSGYCLDFDIYTGRNTVVSRNGLGFDVVTELALNYYHKNHHIYCDRFFTSPLLLEELRQNGTYCCGTVNLQRRGLPNDAKKRKVGRNTTVTYKKDSMVLTTWKDKRQVNILSTNHPAASQNHSEVEKPAIVEMYNQHMAGVDKQDQLSSYYRIGRASHKWWRYIMFFLINTAVTNAWILWKKSDDHPAEMQKFDHLKFRLHLADELRGGFASKKRARGRPSSTIVPCINTVKGHELVRIQGRVRICRQCPRSQRFTASGKKKETSFMCETCKVPMCRFPCFAEFHGLREA